MKKNKLVPFNRGVPCWWDKGVPDLAVGEVLETPYGIIERRENIEFEETFIIVGFSHGCSSAKLNMVKSDDKEDESGYIFKWEVFLTDTLKVIERSKGLVVSGVWTFTKRGENWAIKLVEPR